MTRSKPESPFQSKRSRRLLWFVLLYGASAAAFAAFTYALRAVIPH